MSIDYDKEFIETLEDIKFMSNQIKASIRNGNNPSFKGKKRWIMLILKEGNRALKNL